MSLGLIDWNFLHSNLQCLLALVTLLGKIYLITLYSFYKLLSSVSKCYNAIFKTLLDNSFFRFNQMRNKCTFNMKYTSCIENCRIASLVSTRFRACRWNCGLPQAVFLFTFTPSSTSWSEGSHASSMMSPSVTQFVSFP